MATTLEQTYKLPNLISTIPTTTASVEQSFSALMGIKTYLHSTDSQDRQSTLTSLNTESLSCIAKENPLCSQCGY